MKEVSFEGWKNCVELTSGSFKIIVTTEVGPRIIGGFINGSENIFFVKPQTAGKKGGDSWNIFGGHRLWHSPEAKPRCYDADNHKVKVSEAADGSVSFCRGKDHAGIFKTVIVQPLGKNKFKITHKLRNDNMWDVELAAWALSVMAPGGVAVVPQPQGDKKSLLPNRYLTLWPYTNMADKRYTWGEKYILLRQNKNLPKTKFGLNCEDGWLAYANKGVALKKSFTHMVDGEYPDNGCSIECFSNMRMLEIETLSPLYLMEPGEEITHEEIWEGIKNVGEIKTEEDAAKYFGKK